MDHGTLVQDEPEGTVHRSVLMGARTNTFSDLQVVFLILCLCPLALFQRPGVGRAHVSL